MSDSSRRRFVRRDALAALGLAAAITGAGAAAASAQQLDVVAGNLANPRGMSFGPGGDLYVAEAGRGGSGRCIAAPEGGRTCYGATGRITRIDVRSGRKRTIARRLPSLAVQGGETPRGNATGPHDISFNGRTGYFTVGLAAPPAQRQRLGRAGRRFAALYRLDRRGNVRRLADLGAYEQRRNPDAGQPSAKRDSNPFSVDATGQRILVTDAGGNDLLRVTRRGQVSTLTTFPFGQAPAPAAVNAPPGTLLPVQPVPTGVVRGSNGVAYVGQLTGFPFPMGAANVFRVAGAGPPQVQAGGFTNIVDIGLGDDGALYVLQISTQGLAGPPSPGRLFRIAPNGTRTELAAGRLRQPSGVAVADDGDVYVSDRGGSPTGGRIVRIPASGGS
jgi:hypothetical protein